MGPHFATILRLEDEVESEKPIMAYVVDSLAAVELCNWVRSEFRADLTTLSENREVALFISSYYSPYDVQCISSLMYNSYRDLESELIRRALRRASNSALGDLERLSVVIVSNESRRVEGAAESAANVAEL